MKRKSKSGDPKTQKDKAKKEQVKELNREVNKTVALAVAIVLVSLVVALYLYPHMPDQMASHWNFKGEVDGHMSKFWGMMLLPSVGLLVLFLLILLPKIDPLKKNVDKFRKHYDHFIILILLFFTYIYGLTLLWNRGYTFNMNNAIIPAIALLFFSAGILIGKSKPNWFIGIRTPWTLSDERVWNSTHKLGARMFKATGVVILLGLFFKEQAYLFMLVPIVITVVYVILYSYLQFRKLNKK